MTFSELQDSSVFTVMEALQQMMVGMRVEGLDDTNLFVGSQR